MIVKFERMNLLIKVVVRCYCFIFCNVSHSEELRLRLHSESSTWFMALHNHKLIIRKLIHFISLHYRQTAEVVITTYHINGELTCWLAVTHLQLINLYIFSQ